MKLKTYVCDGPTDAAVGGGNEANVMLKDW